MALKREAFIGQYLDELGDNIKNLDNAIIILKRDPENDEELNRASRLLHTVKGSSRMLKFGTMEKLAHGLESVLKGVKEKRYPVDENIVQLVFVTTERLREGMRLISENGSDAMDVTALLDVQARACANEPYSLQALASAQAPAQARTAAEPAAAESPAESPASAGDYRSIRVKTERIDEIIGRLDTLIINQLQFKKHCDGIRNFEEELKEATGGGAMDRQAALTLMKTIQKIRKSFVEQIELVERDTFELQERIIGLRMFPLEMILGAMPKMVEEMAMALGKRIRLDVRGGDINIDKVILESIQDPLIHLVRNSADHGIESPEQRLAAGKPAEGRIDISCRGESGSIIITIADDGRGISFDGVRARGIAMFPARKDEIEAMSEGELVSLLFLPGFSTSSRVTELSGRGVGLDIVKFNIEKVKGKISLESAPGSGTVITLTLPLTLATIEGYFVRSGERKFFIPAHFIREVLLVGPEDRIPMLNREAVKVRDRLIPLYSLSVLLDTGEAARKENSFVLIVESLGSAMAVAIDSVLEYATLIFKSLPENLAGIACIQGIVFDESYNIVTILHMPALIERSKRLTDMDLKTRYAGARKRDRFVLVVDDSLNSREIQKSILEAAGYGVVTAQDGIEALEKLHGQDVHLVITDISMPRMDGFTLMENVKRDESLRRLPVVVVSNYDDAETSERALKLGAASYIVKSDFDRTNLVEVVDRLIGSPGESHGR
ncbi:MAG: response regulator [Spirochaetes bacterium]|nr:response regulator [Spirochaetota bacterium]